MNRRTQLGHAAVAALTVITILLVATYQPLATAAPLAQPLLAVSPSSREAALNPNSSVGVSFTLTNNTSQQLTVNASFGGVPSGFSVTQQSSVGIASGSSSDFSILVASQSTGQAPGSYGPVSVTFTAVASSGPNITASAAINITIVGATFTPTPSPTRTPTVTTSPTASPTPSLTPTRGPVCEDGFEGDGKPATAKTIDVNTSQERVICPVGDEDWLSFGAVGGKVYTIDVSSQNPGIDLSLELLDAQMRQIAFNDDFFLRDPANPNPGDTRPRITIRMPADGRYFVRVRDTAGRGGVEYRYVIALIDGSYGPTPAPVSHVCLDTFEPDGLPEQARLITSNEIQENRSLCPTGDADWITFFAKKGKRYLIYTDTRRYRGRNTVNGETQAGADTVLVLTDRDGVSLLDVNDDISGESTLDSLIEFTPEVDGFYFAQIKNIGEIGNQFIRYDLVLLLCLSGQPDCGRVALSGPPVLQSTEMPIGTPIQNPQFDPTRTPTPRP